MSQSNHLHTEVTVVPGGNHIVSDHGQRLLVVFKQFRRLGEGEAEIKEEASELDKVLDKFGCSDELCFGCGKTHGRCDFG